MKILYSSIKNHEEYEFNSSLDEYFLEKNNICQKVLSSKGKIIFDKMDNIIRGRFLIDFNVIVYSSYTNEPFETVISVDDDLYFTDVKDLDSDDVFYINSEIDLDECAYSLLITSIPLNLHKPGESIPNSVLEDSSKENEEIKENNEKYSPFDKLKDINFDD